METTTDTTSAAPVAPPAPTPIKLADVAGKWAVRLMPESGDSTLAKYEFVATGDSAGWTLNFPKRKPIPIRVVGVAGDSIVAEAGPFESVLHKGVKVKMTCLLSPGARFRRLNPRKARMGRPASAGASIRRM